MTEPISLEAKRLRGNILPEFWCDVHLRGLAYPEWKSGGCWWCDPSKVPDDQQPKNGKLTKMSAYRNKVYANIRDLTEFERTHPQRLWPKRQSALEDYQPPAPEEVEEEDQTQTSLGI